VSAVDLERYLQALEKVNPIGVHGKVTKVVGLTIEGHGPGSLVGGICDIFPKERSDPVRAEIVGFRDNRMILMPLGGMEGIGPGGRISNRSPRATVNVSPHLLGRVVDGLGRPIDGRGPTPQGVEYTLYPKPMNPLRRLRVREPLDVGVRCINALLACGKGQRMGIFSGSGVGKSVLMGMMARNTAADVSVIGLIGERGREVREFIENDLGEEGLRRSVVVVATSDQPPLIRIRGAFLAMTIAEHFRDHGNDVLLMMDSLTRFAMALREVGLAVGEPPTTKGFTPSVFSTLPRLLERVGTTSSQGNITGLYTVLVEGDDLNEPLSDTIRATLDGHITLSRDLAVPGHYPAIDPLQSVSRTMINVVGPDHIESAQRVLSILDTYRRAEDLINLGAYVSGSNPTIDYAVSMIDRVRSFLTQPIGQKVTFEESKEQLNALFN
jgi:flagellum-specific ATP synthase